MNALTSMKWLIRREFWENRGSLLWAPAAVAGAMTALIGGAALWKFGIQDRTQHRIEVDGQIVQLGDIWTNVGPQQKAAVVEVIANGPWVAAAPLMLLMAIVVFFYCLGALYDERRDRSILFWKSLPLSDSLTVGSKVLVATVLAPLIVIAVATATSLLLQLICGLVALSHGLNVFGDVLAHPGFYLAPFKLLAVLPVYALWALPTVGWLMLVSSWARSKPFLWAVAAPLIVGVVIKWSEYLGSGLDSKWYFEHIVLNALGRLVAPGWLSASASHGKGSTGFSVNSGFDTGALVQQAYQHLLSPEVLIGAVAGAAMLYGAVRLRRWKDEG